jgi:hypothetical protein
MYKALFFGLIIFFKGINEQLFLLHFIHSSPEYIRAD